MKKIKITKKQASLLNITESKNGPKVLSNTPVKYKITKSQYNRLVESELKGGANRVNKAFKQAVVTSDIENLSEEDFNINKPNTEVPPLRKTVGDIKPPVHENTDENLELFNIIAKYVKDPDDIEFEMGRYQELGYKALSIPLQAQLSGDIDFITYTQKGHDDDQLKREIGESDNGDDSFDKEIFELVKHLYGKSDNLSPYWSDKGISYSEICKLLLDNKTIVDKGGVYEISKNLGTPEAGIKAVGDTLRELTQTEVEQGIEEVGYPAGAQSDSAAPYNKPKPMYSNPKKTNKGYEVVTSNVEIALVKDSAGNFYVLDYYNIPKEDLRDYASVEKTYMGDEDGIANFEYGDFEVDNEILTNYVNDNVDSFTTGEGVGDFEGDVTFVKVNQELKNDLLTLFDKDKAMVSALSTIEEELKPEDIAKSFTQQLAPPVNKVKKTPEIIKAALAKKRAEEETRRKDSGEITETNMFISDESVPYILNYIKDTLKTHPDMPGTRIGHNFNMDFDTAYNVHDFDALIDDYNLRPKVDEMTSAGSASTGGSSGPFVGPMNAGVVKKGKSPAEDLGELIDETTVAGSASTGGSSGPYDANALPNISRSGKFKTNPAKTKAEKSTQYPDGGFVEMGDCTKLNNGKGAQNGGCSSGAVDNVVKVKKTKDSIISPSLSENKTTNNKKK